MLEFFNSIPAKELEKFGEFINSPYFNKSKSVRKLFDYLKRNHPSISKNHISPRKISLIVYSQRKINRDKIRKLCSEFMKLYERFLAQKLNERYSTRNRIVSLNYMRLNNLEKRFRKNLSALNQEFSKHIPIGYDDYAIMLQFRSELLSYYYCVSLEEFLKNVKEYSKAADVFYIYNKLISYNCLLNEQNKNIKAEIIKDPAFQFIKFKFEDNQEYFQMNHPEMVINYYDLMLRLYFDDKYVRKLISYYNLNKKKIKNRLRFICLMSIEGYLRVKMSFEETENKMSDVKFLHKVHDELYMKTDLFRINAIDSEGHFPLDMFLSAVGNAQKLGKTMWAKIFIEKNIGFVLPELKESVYNHCTALILFFEKRYEEALSHLVKVSHHKLYINSRILQLKIYFENAEYTLAEYHLSALKKFIQRSKEVSARSKRKTGLFIRYYNLLLKLVTSNNKNINSDIEELKYKLNNHEEYFYNRIWINEVLERLRNERRKNKL